jgi:NADH:ubiquinone oxidoreductase subunit K
MIPPIYLFALSFSLLSIGLASIASNRNIIVMLLSVELIFIASTIILASSFYYNPKTSPDAVIMLFSIFSVAAVEVMAVITFYIYLKYSGTGFDMRKLSKIRW